MGVLKSQDYCVFSFAPGHDLSLETFTSPLSGPSCYLFISCLLPTLSPLSFFIFSPPPHLHSFLFSIPSSTLCPLTLNHRWTKQWDVSHSIKTNNPVTGRVAVPSRSCGNQALRSLGPSSHKSQKAMIQLTDGHLKQLTNTHTHTVTQKWEHQEAFLSKSISCLSFHTLSYLYLIHQREVWN